MSKSNALAALRAAILEARITRQDAQNVLDRYQEFTAKLTEFQQHGGTIPTHAEFAAWRDDILLMWAVKEEEIKANSAAPAPLPHQTWPKPSGSSELQ